MAFHKGEPELFLAFELLRFGLRPLALAGNVSLPLDFAARTPVYARLFAQLMTQLDWRLAANSRRLSEFFADDVLPFRDSLRFEKRRSACLSAEQLAHRVRDSPAQQACAPECTWRDTPPNKSDPLFAASFTSIQVSWRTCGNCCTFPSLTSARRNAERPNSFCCICAE